MRDESKLRVIKVVHTLIWAVLAGSVVASPVLACFGYLSVAWGLIGLVTLEAVVLLTNHNRCPLTDIAGRYTQDRRDNFDIYLPQWLAHHNKTIFGVVHIAGVVYVIWMSHQTWG